jgi:acyl dehydratase
MGVQMDLSDVDPRVGVPVGGGEPWEPVAATDVRRWVMAMDYANPLHYDEQFAGASRFGRLVAPQSFAAAMDYVHGVRPSLVGYIPGSHMIFGGEEWWFYGPRIFPGDRITHDRIFQGYKMADTKFAGPTMFSYGDTIHKNDRGETIAKARSTSVRYLAEEAAKRGFYREQAPAPKWTREALDEVARTRLAWIESNREGVSPHFDAVKVGDQLPRRALGPHSIESFTTEYRAFVFNAWGAFYLVAPEGVADPWINQDAGWLGGFAYDWEAARIDPREGDGLYVGPSRGHTDVDRASQIGMPRRYGYGASMGAWITDYLAYWAGIDGTVRHVNSQFRAPAFEHDVTYLDADVIGKQPESDLGVPLVEVRLVMTNQDAAELVRGTAEIELPRESSRKAERVRYERR